MKRILAINPGIMPPTWPFTKGFRKMNLLSQDKGHGAEGAVFVKAVEQGLASPIPFEQTAEVTKVTLELTYRT